MATQSTLPPDGGTQSQPILHPIAVRGYGTGNSTVIGPRLNASKHTMVPVSGSPRDIICGYGPHLMKYYGKFNLHIIVDRHRELYLTSRRKQKAAIIRHIVQQIKSTGARFLRRLNEDSDDRLVEADDSTAYRKVSHALRLKKNDHGKEFLKYSVDRQQTRSSQNFLLLPHLPCLCLEINFR